MPEIVCPECGRSSNLLTIRRSAEEFCGHCDFPLFWAPSSLPVTERGSNSDATLRRLPGAGGRQRVGSKVCPACGELNPLGETHCLRCRTDLDPKPVAPPPPPRTELLAPPRPIVVEPERPWWHWVAAGGVAVFLIVVFLIAIMIG